MPYIHGRPGCESYGPDSFPALEPILFEADKAVFKTLSDILPKGRDREQYDTGSLDEVNFSGHLDTYSLSDGRMAQCMRLDTVHGAGQFKIDKFAGKLQVGDILLLLRQFDLDGEIVETNLWSISKSRSVLSSSRTHAADELDLLSHMLKDAAEKLAVTVPNEYAAQSKPRKSRIARAIGKLLNL